VLAARRRVLVVEDLEENRAVVQLYLKSLPFEVHVAENGAIGVAKFREGPYDLVLMDMQMPVMDGYDATRTIRAWEHTQGRHRQTPVVALTASAFPEDVERALAAGCTAYITKPLHKSVLLKAIEDYIAEEADQAA
jgi:CheY-like chemotaxis protein